jgi:CubicO group peptidase (beta-lactamase class C family)
MSMAKIQFRVLYREFLFRMVDLDLLSAGALGDMNKLFGQFAALFIFIGIAFAFGGLIAAGSKMAPETKVIVLWSAEHFLIATTMLVVGVFAILSWDSTFPTRRELMMLAPLPVRARTIFLAKVAAVATAFGVTILTLHFAAGFTWAMALNPDVPAQPAPALSYEPAMPPVGPAELKGVLGVPALEPGNGIAIGVWKQGKEQIITYGTARPDSIFQIASISKTFTALILAQMVERGKTTFDEPVRNLLPPGVATKPSDFPGLREITLLDLATHHSGLPSGPDNLTAKDDENPLADYHTADLYEYLGKRGLERYRHVEFDYSNLGFGLLGHALANRAGTTWQDLLEQYVTGPLGLKDTTTSLSAGQQRRMIQGYNERNRPVPPWDLDVFAGAGAIRSTAGDMIAYLKANLHPALQSDKALATAIARTHQLQAVAGRNDSIALAWIYDDTTGVYWHTGAVYGYTSYAWFDPKYDSAAVVLSNRFSNITGLLGPRIRAKLAGLPAVSLDTTMIPASGGALHFIRVFGAYWVTMVAAGAFIFCCVLGVQGLAAQLLPRRLFLRISSFLQIAAFFLFVAVYFLEPKIAAPGQSQPYIDWSPSYWFLGLLQQLSGSPALASLARRAWIGSAVAISATAVAYILSYLRTMRQIVEEPDITPVIRLRSLVPGFGNPVATAIGQFSVRTLLRSRQHRLLLSFFLGVGFAATIFFVKSPVAQEFSEAQGNVALLGSTMLIIGLCVVGTRVVFALPTDLRANWIFRIVPIRGGPRLLGARRGALYAISVIPVWTGCAVLFLSTWPWRAAVEHLVILGLLGFILSELCLLGTQKIPFTCSYLPGKSNFNITFLISVSLIFALLGKTAQVEREAFEDPVTYSFIAAGLLVLAIGARWRVSRLAESYEGALQFEEESDPAIFMLDLHRDGITSIAPTDEPARGAGAAH